MPWFTYWRFYQCTRIDCFSTLTCVLIDVLPNLICLNFYIQFSLHDNLGFHVKQKKSFEHSLAAYPWTLKWLKVVNMEEAAFFWNLDWFTSHFKTGIHDFKTDMQLYMSNSLANRLIESILEAECVNHDSFLKSHDSLKFIWSSISCVGKNGLTADFNDDLTLALANFANWSLFIRISSDPFGGSNEH